MKKPDLKEIEAAIVVMKQLKQYSIDHPHEISPREWVLGKSMHQALLSDATEALENYVSYEKSNMKTLVVWDLRITIPVSNGTDYRYEHQAVSHETEEGALAYYNELMEDDSNSDISNVTLMTED